MKQTRAPKLLGDFGEGLVTYALIRKGYEVACVDHVGADLLAEKDGEIFAISVKTRLFREKSIESLHFVVEENHLEKLENFAVQFRAVPVFSLLLCLSKERKIHLLIIPVKEMRVNLPRAQHGYSIRFNPRHRKTLIAMPFVDYSYWTEEQIGCKDFIQKRFPVPRRYPVPILSATSDKSRNI